MKVSHDATFTAGLHCDKHFFPQLQYTCVSFKIPCQYWYFCPIYYDQKYSTEFNSFKVKIFANIWRVTFCLYVVQRTCKFWNKKYIYYGLHRKQAFQLQKQNLLCCYLLVVSKHVPKHVPNTPVSRRDWWTVQKSMCAETWNCWLLCLTCN